MSIIELIGTIHYNMHVLKFKPQKLYLFILTNEL